MSNQEVYFKIKLISELPVILVGYSYIDHYGVVQLGSTLPISFHDSDEFNINKMSEISSKKVLCFGIILLTEKIGLN